MLVCKTQEAYKPNMLLNHSKFHATDLQLLLLSSNQNTVVHRKWNSNVIFTLKYFQKKLGWLTYPSLMTFELASKFHVYLPWANAC